MGGKQRSTAPPRSSQLLTFDPHSRRPVHSASSPCYTSAVKLSEYAMGSCCQRLVDMPAAPPRGCTRCRHSGRLEMWKR